MAGSFDAYFMDNEAVKDCARRSNRHAVDTLRQSQVVEIHRNSNGRDSSLKRHPAPDEVIVSTPNDCNSKTLQQRRSSFSISARVLRDLEQMRSSAEIVDGCSNDRNDRQQREDSSDQSANGGLWDTRDRACSKSLEDRYLSIHASQEQGDTKSVASFGLWCKAAKNKRLPDAIIFAPSSPNESKPSAACLSSSVSLSSKTQPTETRVPSVSEMVSQLHITHPPLAALALIDMPKAMSLTRSISPRIRRSGFSSLPTDALLRRASLVPSNKKVAAEVQDSSPLKANNISTQWKRGELIGEGTFGKVYKGLNTATGELFALKEIEIHSSPNADQVTQMQKLGEEIQLMNTLRHKHIVRYEGSSCSASHFYIFMEYVPGGSIASMVKQFDAFNEDLIRIFTRQIVQGVRYLHQMGIIHRDIKGANVLVTEQGVAKLADFGCSKQIPQLRTTSFENSLKSIRGSVPWMAPEVIKQIGHGSKADIWSIGATVIEMATARHPWPHCHTGLAAMYTIAMATSPPPFPDHLSGQAQAFLQRCLCIDPEDRATALELSDHNFLTQKQ